MFNFHNQNVNVRMQIYKILEVIRKSVKHSDKHEHNIDIWHGKKGKNNDKQTIARVK